MRETRSGRWCSCAGAASTARARAASSVCLPKGSDTIVMPKTDTRPVWELVQQRGVASEHLLQVGGNECFTAKGNARDDSPLLSSVEGGIAKPNCGAPASLLQPGGRPA